MALDHKTSEHSTLETMNFILGMCLGIVTLVNEHRIEITEKQILTVGV